MAVDLSNKFLKRDGAGLPVPQIYDTVADDFAVAEGADGIPSVRVVDSEISVNATAVVDDPVNYATATHQAVIVGTSNVQVLAANANRVYVLLVNDSDSVIYIALGQGAALNFGIRLNPNGGSYEMSRRLGNVHAGAISAVTSASGKRLLVTQGA